ncbi:MAG: DUF4159 domain-containing protein [Deferribacteres bacterium]|nr:DUF4159 domain-containing protein [candidate division KSB1 bacterium]MCB9502925.1 DUF4159 domain-containing protein [Deferribacteres bacterium]
MKKKLVKITLIILVFSSIQSLIFAQEAWDRPEFTMARIKYNGGGDWYNDRSCIPNMLHFLSQNTAIRCAVNERYVELNDPALFSYPFLFLTGHGNVEFSEAEAKELRTYLSAGGFLYADDDYGMDETFRKQIKKVFPEEDWVELPFNFEIFHNVFNFTNGVPKIHEHDGGPGKTFAIFHHRRLVILYTFNTNISDGWADADVHNDPEYIREKAFQFGTNIIVYALSH